MTRPRFSLLSLLLLSLACAAGLGVYWRSDAWVVDRIIPIPTSNRIYSALVSPDGKRILVQSSDTEISCYSIEGRLLWGPLNAKLYLTQISADNRWLLVEDEGFAHIILHDLETGARKQAIQSALGDATVVSPNGKYLHQAGGTFACWRMSDGGAVAKLENYPSHCFPTDEFLAEQKRVSATSINAALNARDLVAYCEAARGPRVANIPVDTSPESNAPQGPAMQTHYYPYAVPSHAWVSGDGSRILTALTSSSDSGEPERYRLHAALWNGDSLERMATVAIPEHHILHSFSPAGDRAVLVGVEKSEVRVISIPDGRTLLQIDGMPGYSHLDDTRITSDGLYLCEVFSRREGPTETKYRTRVTRLADGRLISEMDDILRADAITPDMLRKITDSDSLGDFKTAETLFTFRHSNDENAESNTILALLADNEHVLTNGENGFVLLWKRLRPEWWWGHFWRWEVYVCFAFSLACLWSLLPRLASSRQSEAGIFLAK